jgi:hypothetical protein
MATAMYSMQRSELEGSIRACVNSEIVDRQIGQIDLVVAHVGLQEGGVAGRTWRPRNATSRRR